MQSTPPPPSGLSDPSVLKKATEEDKEKLRDVFKRRPELFSASGRELLESEAEGPNTLRKA